MPILGLGGGIFGGGAEEAIVSAIKLGYRLVDTSPKYGTEAALGRAIARSGVTRADVFVQTKVCNVGYTTALRSFARSLERLGLDYVDLLLMHSGISGAAKADPRSPRHSEDRAGTWRAMCQLKQEGKVRSIGVCNFSLRMLRELSRAEPPAVLQLEWHPLLQRWHVLRYCREQGIVVQGYGSGGGGWRLWRKRPELELLRRAPMQLAAHGKSAHQVCKANVTVSSSIVASNALASNARWQLTRREPIPPKRVRILGIAP